MSCRNCLVLSTPHSTAKSTKAHAPGGIASIRRNNHELGSVVLRGFRIECLASPAIQMSKSWRKFIYAYSRTCDDMITQEFNSNQKASSCAEDNSLMSEV